MKTYILDFKNRVTIPSIKNFQLIDNQNEVVMQFGRVGSNAFTMDFKVDYLQCHSFIVSTHPVSSLFNSINKILSVMLQFHSLVDSVVGIRLLPSNRTCIKEYSLLLIKVSLIC